MPEGAQEGILRGMYPLVQAEPARLPQVRLLGSGTILREVLAAADLLRQTTASSADVYSVTSFTELRREGHGGRALEPPASRRGAAAACVEESLDDGDGPVVAATDYMRAFADQIRPWVHAPYRVLGTDGFGRSDYRKALRDFFEVDRHSRRAGGADLAGRRRRGRRLDRRPRRSRPTASTPSGRRRGGLRGARWRR